MILARVLAHVVQGVKCCTLQSFLMEQLFFLQLGINACGSVIPIQKLQKCQTDPGTEKPFLVSQFHCDGPVVAVVLILRANSGVYIKLFRL